MISVSWSIQRADKGEQPWWMGIVLAATLGQIGLPGRGITLGYNCTHDLGTEWALPFQWAHPAQQGHQTYPKPPGVDKTPSRTTSRL